MFTMALLYGLNTPNEHSATTKYFGSLLENIHTRSHTMTQKRQTDIHQKTLELYRTYRTSVSPRDSWVNQLDRGSGCSVQEKKAQELKNPDKPLNGRNTKTEIDFFSTPSVGPVTGRGYTSLSKFSRLLSIFFSSTFSRYTAVAGLLNSYRATVYSLWWAAGTTCPTLQHSTQAHPSVWIPEDNNPPNKPPYCCLGVGGYCPSGCC